jgi:hypothetical protein
MSHPEFIIGIGGVVLGQIVQIAYHQLHDRKQNDYLREIRDLLTHNRG